MSDAVRNDRALVPSYEERVVAVTGASTFLGSELIARMEADRRYARVLAIDVERPACPLAKTDFHEIDLTHSAAAEELAGALRGAGVDTLVHAALLTRPARDAALGHELHSAGTMRVLDAAGAAGVRKLLLHSTTMVYGPDPSHPAYLTEEHERRGLPGSRFVEDHLDAEEQFHRFSAAHPQRVVTVLRPAATLGPSINGLAARFLRRPVCPVALGYDPLVQLLHQDDLVAAFQTALEEDHPGDYNLAGDGVLPYTTVLAMLGRIPLPAPLAALRPLGQALWSARIGELPPALLGFLRYPCLVDAGRARREMGFRPRHDIRATLRDFLGLDAAGGVA